MITHITIEECPQCEEFRTRIDIAEGCGEDLVDILSEIQEQVDDELIDISRLTILIEKDPYSGDFKYKLSGIKSDI